MFAASPTDFFNFFIAEAFDRKLCQLEHIVDTEHRDGVLDLGETFQGFCADALGGRVGVGEGRVAFLEIFEFAEELVVFRIGDFWFGVVVIESVVVVDEPPQLRHARFWRGKVGEKIQLVGHGKGISDGGWSAKR